MERTQAALTEEKRKSLESVYNIRHCSMAELFASGIKPDVVVADPPYAKKFLPLYGELAELCAKAKIPVVAVMCGLTFLPEVLNRMTAHLDYRWMLAYLTPGGQAAQHKPKVNSSWKPILRFGKAHA